MAVNRSLLDKVLRGLRPVIILLAVLSITAVVLNWLRLEAELQTYRQEAVDNIHWNVSQLELDLVRFGSEAEILQLKPDESFGEQLAGGADVNVVFVLCRRPLAPAGKGGVAADLVLYQCRDQRSVLVALKGADWG